MAKIAPQIDFDYQRFSKQGDIMLAGGVIVILGVMLVPMPTIVIDMMLSLSISLSLVVLVTSMFISSPLEFSIYPSLLLVTTLLRLALNVASTRLILMHGDEGTGAAGMVIKSFGEFVVGGNYLIGIVVFFILFSLNKSVIVTGTTRIAEVAARFTLDAMPGKQMAIEADLNAGLINEAEANSRRERIRKEADFYGAMDGAGKFVSGDVQATILILAINIIGGFLIGMLQKGMDWKTAAATYTILTIGDGLVTIIPSIVISTSAGLIVSRAASEAKMGEEFIAQLTFHPKALKLVSAMLFVFGLVPGMPFVPFTMLSALIFAVSKVSQKQKDIIATGQEAEKTKPAKELETPEEVQQLLPLDLLELEVGYGLIPLVDEDQNGNLLARIRSIRRQFALDMGVIVPSLHLRDNLQLKPGQYTVLIRGNEVASGEILIDHYLAMDPGSAQRIISSINQQLEKAMLSEGQPVLLVSPVSRPHLAQLLNRFIPTLPVISQAEIPAEIRLQSLATIGLNNAG